MTREQQLKACAREIEEICKKYGVELEIDEQVDYNWNEDSYISESSITFLDETDNIPMYWDYYDLLK